MCLLVLSSHFLVAWSFGECSFAPVLPRNFISCMLGRDAPCARTNSDPMSSNQGQELCAGTGRLREVVSL